jgi:hypothetical protein
MSDIKAQNMLQLTIPQDTTIATLRAETLEEAARGMAKRLVQRYEADPTRIAELCDSVLDRSGKLLGYVREEAAAIRTLKR